MGEKNRNKKWENRLPDYAHKLQVIGENGVVQKSVKTSKASDKERASILVGFADQHATGTYRMFILDTHKISVTKDVT